MRRDIYYRLAAITAAAALLAGCATQEPPMDKFSGYLGSYSGLQEVPGSHGTRYRWVSPELNPKKYHAVLIPDVVFYPEPQPTARVSQQTLDEIQKYATTALRRATAQKTKVVNTPGKGVVVIKVAITAVAHQEKGLAPYQYVPIAFVVTTASRAATGTPDEAKLIMEGQATDSLTGVILGKAVRTGTGKELAKAASGEKVVTLADLQPLIDAWARDVVEQTNQFVAPR